MDKSCVPVAKLAVTEKSTDIAGKVPAAFGFAVIISAVLVLPGKGLFHQQFLKTIFDFGRM